MTDRLEFAKALGREAGVMAHRGFGRSAATLKGRHDILTAMDAEVERFIRRSIAERFPADAVIGEEEGGAEGERLWIIDPIDGTANYAHGYPYYAVSIALARGAELTHAVVLDPVHDELFTAVKGKGAALNGAPIRPSSCTALERALVGTVFPVRASPKMPAYLPIFNALVTQCAGIRRAGACALDLCYVAAGRLDGFFVMSLKSWDVAAGALIVQEAGGRVGDFAGGNEFLRTDETIAATSGLFNPLREAIAAARR